MNDENTAITFGVAVIVMRSVFVLRMVEAFLRMYRLKHGQLQAANSLEAARRLIAERRGEAPHTEPLPPNGGRGRGRIRGPDSRRGVSLPIPLPACGAGARG